ncbi:MAG: response regulator [Anaerolineae bacterium]
MIPNGGGSAQPLVTRLQVHEALECLYDGPSLAQTDLAACLPLVSSLRSVPERALKLRALLLDAIELLQPDRPESFRSAATRSYDVLTLRFVRGLSMARIASELHVSERQAYRDLALAEERLADALSSGGWEPVSAQPTHSAPGAELVGAELHSIPQQSASVDTGELLAYAKGTVEPLARQLGVAFDCSLPDTSLAGTGDEVLLRTTFVQMLSIAVRHAAGGRVRIEVQPGAKGIAVVVSFLPRSGGELRGAFGSLASLTGAQRLACSLEPGASGMQRICLTLPRLPRRLVLVLEDSASAVELYRRYLAESSEWEIIAAPSANAALHMAVEKQVAVIVLDLLMPEKDGWQVLQTLRALPETAKIPVLVCSVFDEADLASALGASAFLKKPVSRDQFLSALRACYSVRQRPKHNQA